VQARRSGHSHITRTESALLTFLTHSTSPPRTGRFLAAIAAAAVAAVAAAAPASANVKIVYDAGYYGHYNCDIGNGVYFQDGTSGTWTDANGKSHSVSCTNGKLTTTRAVADGTDRIVIGPAVTPPADPAPISVDPSPIHGG
jgi:hypothetical protein